MAKIDERVFISALQERFADYVPQNTAKAIIADIRDWMRDYFICHPEELPKEET